MTDDIKDTKPKLDLFDLLNKIDSGNRTFFDDLDDDLKKQFSPLLTMRWSSSAGGTQALLLNELVNTTVFRMYNHPGLMYRLLVTSSNKKKMRYDWIKKKPKDKSKPLSAEVIRKYYNCPNKDARIYLKRLPLEEILDMADALGYDGDTVKDIKNEFK